MGDGGLVELLERDLRRHYHIGQTTGKEETPTAAHRFNAELLQDFSQISLGTSIKKRSTKISTLPLTSPMNYEIDYECRWGVPPPA